MINTRKGLVVFKMATFYNAALKHSLKIIIMTILNMITIFIRFKTKLYKMREGKSKRVQKG